MESSSIRSVLILLFLLVAATFSSAQASASASTTATDSVPTFRSRAELVYVPVIVKDNKGNHLPGLKQEAFSIEQDGKPVHPSIFEEILNAGDEMVPPREVPGMISNYTASDERPKRLLIIVIDTLNTPALYQDRVKRELLKFLETAVPPNEPVALFGLGRHGLRQLHPFTTNTSLLIAAIKKVRARIGSADDLAAAAPQPARDVGEQPAGAPNAVELQFRDFLAEGEWKSGYTAVRQRQSVRLTLLSFQQLANAFAAVPGRKAVVWATGGFPFSIDDPSAFNGMGMEFFQDYERTWRVLTAANIAVYPIDVLGMIAPDWYRYSVERSIGTGTDVGAAGAEKFARAGSDPFRAPFYDYNRQRQDTMRAVAHSTGGLPCVDRNDLRKCFIEAASDSASYYLLGYYLRGEQKPGWHKLKVKVAGEHGEVRARQGFYTGETPKQLEQRRLEDMYVAVASPVDYTGVHFAIREPRLQRSPDGKTKLSVDVVVPGTSFRIAAQQQNRLDLDVLAVALGSGGKVAGLGSHNLRGTPTAASAFRVEKEGLRLTSTMSLEPGKYVLRVAVRDNQTGQIGTVHTPVKVKQR